ncbi:MAG TPA: hypothetical protein VNG51_12430 [Ktedonobacteraceae bacterium]|nr:hypothetical protein [Ktedonobacteraceae bacterium]
MTRWAYLEISVDPQTGRVTHIDGKEVTNPQTAPLARQVRNQLGSEGWELVSAQATPWIFKREVVAEQQWEYCCLAEDHAGGLRKGEWILVYYRADGNHVEHEHRRLGTALAQLGKQGWHMTGVATPGSDDAYDNTTFFFARPLSAKKENGEIEKHISQP